MKVQYNQVLSGSRLASADGGLGRDDELPKSFQMKFRNPQLGPHPRGGTPKDKSEIQNLKSHCAIIFLDEVVGCIIVNLVRHLLYQQRLRPVVVVAGICVKVFTALDVR